MKAKPENSPIHWATGHIQSSSRRRRAIGNGFRAWHVPNGQAAAVLEQHQVGHIAAVPLSACCPAAEVRSAARAPGRLGGRKPLSLQDPRVQTAKTLTADRNIPVADICATLKISRAMLYRYVGMN
jgi:hypothetical protein